MIVAHGYKFAFDANRAKQTNSSTEMSSNNHRFPQTKLKNFKLQIIKQKKASDLKPTGIIRFTNSNLEDANQGHHFNGAQKRRTT